MSTREECIKECDKLLQSIVKLRVSAVGIFNTDRAFEKVCKILEKADKQIVKAKLEFVFNEDK